MGGEAAHEWDTEQCWATPLSPSSRTCTFMVTADDSVHHELCLIKSWSCITSVRMAAWGVC